jgi:alpha-tubulin suppressor-like RCC1 family protein
MEAGLPASDGSSLDSVSDVSIPQLPIISVAAGEKHTCVVRSDNRVYCWGSNEFGQLGMDHDSDIHEAPVLVDVRAFSVSAGRRHSCAVTTDHRVACWGANSQCELGRGGCSPFSDPAPAEVLADDNVNEVLSDATDVVVSADHSCAVTSRSTVLCWGHNGYHSVSHSLESPLVRASEVELRSATIAAALGRDYSCFRSDQLVSCVGRFTNETNLPDCGDGVSCVAFPRALDLGPVTSLEAGEDFACAVLSNGDVRCWGIAINRFSNFYFPARAVALGPTNDACFTTVEGSEVYCETPFLSAPVRVDFESGLPIASVRKVALGRAHKCALTAAGKLYCWGKGPNGELGIPGSAPRVVVYPEQVVLPE